MKISRLNTRESGQGPHFKSFWIIMLKALISISICKIADSGELYDRLFYISFNKGNFLAGCSHPIDFSINLKHRLLGLVRAIWML